MQLLQIQMPSKLHPFITKHNMLTSYLMLINTSLRGVQCGEQGWLSGESACLLPMCPRFRSPDLALCGLSLLVLCSAPRGFSPDSLVFPSSFVFRWTKGLQRKGESFSFCIRYFWRTKCKSTETITERCFSCQNKSLCQKLARSCNKWKSAKIWYTPFLHEALQFVLAHLYHQQLPEYESW